MANFLDKIKVKRASGQLNKFDLSCQHITTQEFFTLRPIYARELMASSSISVNADSYVRLAPLDKPFYGSVRMINRAFFVPYRCVMKGFNNFYADTDFTDSTGTARISNATYTNTNDLARAFTLQDVDFLEQVSGDGVADWVYRTQTNNVVSLTPYNFTRKGRIAMTILNSLGYSICSSEVDADNVETNVPISVLPIFAFAKIFCDWYTDASYSSRRNSIENVIASYPRGGFCRAEDIAILLSACVETLYDRDYFTSAWDNPVSPNDSNISSVSIPDVTNDANGGTNYSSTVRSSSLPSNGMSSTPSIVRGDATGQVNYGNNITQYVVDSLKALTDYVKRFQMVGTRLLDRYKALFGIELPEAKLDRSIYCGKSESFIDVADVMAQSDTYDKATDSGAVLGAYAAKGIGASRNQSFSFKTDEFGIFMILSTIVPRVGYVQGIQRQNLHIDRFDFYNGDFDNIGPQAIARAELFNEINSADNWNGCNDWSPSMPWGYQKRWFEYANGFDFMSGDFRFNSKNADLSPWHLFRLFNPTNEDEFYNLEHHDENFDIATPTQYNRIFNYKGDAADHFYCVHTFHVVAYQPMSPSYENYEFDDGRNIMMNLNGTNLN